MNNRLQILLIEYSAFYLGSIRIEGLIKALEKLPDNMIITKNEVVPGVGGIPTTRDKTIAIRLEEVRVEYAIVRQRLEMAKEMIEKEKGGKEALNKWIWEKPKNE